MAKLKKTVKSKSAEKQIRQPKISNIHCPKDMSKEDWQHALRQQTAKNEFLSITGPDDSGCVFTVGNPKSGRKYSVEFFGKDIPYNRCECMDFRTNQLGTCKHIEAVALYENGKYATAKPRHPEHSSVLVNYPVGRKIQLRIGEWRPDEIRSVAKDFFDENGFLINPDFDPSEFISKATKIDPDFLWEDEAFNLLLASREKNYRIKLINDKYAESNLADLLKIKLHPYQVQGVKFAFAGGRTINADEMGLGKTVQAIATAELLRREGLVQSVIVICPTSLKYQWLSEIKRFTNSSALVIEGDLLKRKEQFADPTFFYKICSFHAISNNVKSGHIPTADMIVYDELQRLKNWDTQMGKQLRKLNSQYVMALSGTPLENKLNELYSVTQFVNQFLLGPIYRFTDDTTIHDDTGRIIGYKNLHHVAEMMRDTMIRRRKADVKIQMPGRTDTNMFVPMTKEQMAIHDEYQNQVSILVDKWRRFKFLSETDRKRLLLFLSMMRMVCDSTFIIDQKSRHDTKIEEIKEIISNMLESSTEKVVIFSQWERMLRILSQDLGKEGVEFCFLHGGVPSAKRKQLIDRFRDNPDCRIFLSTDAGATGLNLQSASLLINIDLPWNPAVLEQRIARIYRLGQKNPVQIINMVARGTIEERMLSTLKFKSNLAAGILDGGQDAVFLENNKFGRIIEMVEDVISEDKEEEPKTAVQPPQAAGNNKSDNVEAPNTSAPATSAAKAETMPNSSAPSKSSPTSPSSTVSRCEASKHSDPKAKDEVRDFVAGGITFLGSLANMLAQPEGARNLADALVKEDPDTGQASLNIPIPNKDTIVNLFTSIATLLKAKA